ncbi:MAG: family 78 glycoside hydrolase catalytic domain [Verrucomicrobia bacterium]|nr:family 78 glycoside hydrolase catalytic domain [Verrucomicrobiota bacterium]
MTFPLKAKKIWTSGAPAPNTFSMFRREVEVGAFEQASLRISTGHYYALYVNGEHVTRLFHRYFDFHKQYQDVDIAAYLKAESLNTIALLCYGGGADSGLMAELIADGDVLTATDSSWRWQRYSAYNAQAPGRALLFGIEEQYDARHEALGWSGNAYDDSGWAFCEAVRADNKWRNFTPSTTCNLTYDPVQGESFAALQLCKEREGVKANLTLPRQGIAVFATVITCCEETTISLFASNAPSRVTVDGQPVAMEEDLPLSAGEHLLVLTSLGSLELLIHTRGDIGVSANTLAGADADWAVMVLESQYVKYPWHESPGDVIRQAPEVDEAHGKPTANALKAAFPEAFEAVKTAQDSSFFRVVSQECFMPPNGIVHPMISKVHPPTTTQAEINISDSQGLLNPQDGPCVIRPTEGFDVHFIVDLGREYIGYVDMTLDAPQGTLLDIQCFELLDDTGCFYMRNGFSYVCREGDQQFTSNYRRGGRYISVTIRNMTAPVTFHSLALLHNAAPVERVGQFTCDDALLNTVYEMSRDTAELCMLDTYVDCPGHEQNFWVGDARVTAMVNLLNFGMYGFNQHCIRMVGQSLSPDYVESNFADNAEFRANRFLSMAAFQAYPPASSLPMWSYLWVMQCHDHFLHGGNMEDLEENYGYVSRNMENSLLLTGDRGLLDYDGAYNLIEWATNDLTPYGEVTANSIFMAKSYELVAEMADVLSKAEDAERYRRLAQETKEAINATCWDEERQAYVDTVRDEVSYKTHLRFCEEQEMEVLSYEDYLSLSRISEQTNTLALLYDIAPEDRAQKILPILTRVKEGHYIFGSPAGRSVGEPKEGELVDNIVAIGSPFFLFFTIDALFKTGHGDIAMQVMRRDWGDMLEHGTNTCWETFKMKDGHYTRSIAHAWAASPAVYLQRNVLGITPLKPGFSEFTVTPYTSNLQRASGSVATPHGPIHVSWELNGNGEPRIEVDAPDGCAYVPPE